MSDFLDLGDARQTLRTLVINALEANRALYDGLQHPAAEPPPEHRATLHRILAHLTETREGFVLSLRASDITLASELHDLIAYLIDWTWLETIGLRWNTEEPLEKLGGQVILYQHALIALGVLPRLPGSAVTFPYGGSGAAYVDIPVPGSPGQMLTRLEELEHTIWAASNEPISAIAPDALRRTYGFFEATTWLIANHLGGLIGL